MRFNLFVRDCSPIHSVCRAILTTAIVTTVVWSSFANLASAQLPTAGAEADATAKYEMLSIPSGPVSSPTLAQQVAIIPLSGDIALSRGAGVLSESLGGPIVRGYSEVAGASPNSQGGGTMEATSHASVVSHFEAVGTGPIDLDIEIHISGDLAGGNFFTDTLGNVFSETAFDAVLHTDAGAFPLFSGSATFDMTATASSSVLTATGDWAPTDFTTFSPPSGGFNNQGRSVSLNDMNNNVVTVNPGDVFAIELLLDTAVFAAGPFEAAALADFDSTGAVSLSTDTPGASFVQLAAVPEPASVVTLAIVGFLGLAATRRVAR